MYNLAIVIPAYKGVYLRETLESLANQTCKEFNVYIGDDCSPYDIARIASEYSDKLHLTYKRFSNNLGGSNLVGQWKRCINLTQGEPWINLFSDDDMMTPRCVELFYEEVSNKRKYCLYHFDVNIIDSQNNLLSECRCFPSVINSRDFFKCKATGKLDSFVVEYVFSREIYEKVGGFQYFDMAWGSDIATWIKMGKQDGIRTIEGAKINWRNSEFNITPKLNNEIVFRKFGIEVEYIEWVNMFFKCSNIYYFNKYIFFRSLFHYSTIINKEQANLIIEKAIRFNVINSFDGFCLKKGYAIIHFVKKHFR